MDASSTLTRSTLEEDCGYREIIAPDGSVKEPSAPKDEMEVVLPSGPSLHTFTSRSSGILLPFIIVYPMPDSELVRSSVTCGVGPESCWKSLFSPFGAEIENELRSWDNRLPVTGSNKRAPTMTIPEGDVLEIFMIGVVP